MTYIVAFVRFPESVRTRRDYNFNCLRTDIVVGDQVLVRIGSGRLGPGIVTRLQYLDWDCKGRIECKLAEAIRTPDGLEPPMGDINVVGLVNREQMVKHLRARGWTPLRPVAATHDVILAYDNGEERANIWIRRHGVDLQIVSDWKDTIPRPFAVRDITIGQGRVVRHALSQTRFNLYEGVARFADAFKACENDYDRFFLKVGSSKRTTSELMDRICEQQLEADVDDPDVDGLLYEALGGDGGPVYLGDGLYLGPGGSWIDE